MLVALLLIPQLSIAQQSGRLPPALLPYKTDVAPARASAIDGEWMISTINKRIRIEAGRAWAVDTWAHLMLLQVLPDMVVIGDIERTGPGRYQGNDLPLLGKFSARLRADGMDVEVAGALGPVRYRLLPVSLDDPDAYAAEAGGLVTPVPPVVEPPSVRPPPTPRPNPTPRPSPSQRGCGGAGEQPCKSVPARRMGDAQKLGCPGKQSYFSTLREGSCWRCPDGYRRASPTRRMDHAKACIKRKTIAGPWRKARFEKRAWGCPAGQFHVALGGGSCMSCPAGFKRVATAGIDTLVCKPTNACDRGLRRAKQPPEDNALANLLGASSSKICAPPFDIRAAARRDAGRVNFATSVMQNLAKELLADVQEKKPGNLKQLLRAKNWRGAYAVLQKTAAYRALVASARQAGKRSISIGVTSDIQLIIGGNGEVGLAIDLVEGRVKPYEAVGMSKGIAVGIESGVTLGIWEGPFTSGYAQGFATSISGAVSVGGGMWYSYYDANDGPERLLGVTATAGVGLGAEVGEYNEVGTWLLEDAFSAE